MRETKIGGIWGPLILMLSNQSLNLVFACGAFMVAFVGIVLMVNSKWKRNLEQKEIIKLKTENKDLKKYK